MSNQRSQSYATRLPSGFMCRRACRSVVAALLGIAFLTTSTDAQQQSSDSILDLKKGDRVVLIGNTFAERLQHFGQFETLLQLAEPDLEVTLRNMGWSADEVDLMPRPLDFGELEDHLADKKASVILMCFGANESFDGKPGLEDFRAGMTDLVGRLKGQDFDGRGAVRLVMISPTAHEKLPAPFPDPRERNAMLELYTQAMATFAESHDLAFVDLFHPTLSLMAEHPDTQFTINGIHFNKEGYAMVAEVLAGKLGLKVPNVETSTEPLRALVVEKNKQFFFRWRPINGEYVYGRRKEPFGVVSYPPEMAELDRLTEELDGKIHAEADLLSADAKKEGK